jgi:hypothetical protein
LSLSGARRSGELSATSGLIAGGAFQAAGRNVNYILLDPDIVSRIELEPEVGLGGRLVFRDHKQLRGFARGESDELYAAPARPLP